MDCFIHCLIQSLPSAMGASREHVLNYREFIEDPNKETDRSPSNANNYYSQLYKSTMLFYDKVCIHRERG
jgi:hypothetical protein